MPRPKGNCTARNRCDQCCPWVEGRAAGSWNTTLLSLDSPSNVSGTPWAVGPLTLKPQWLNLYNAPVDLQDDSGTECIVTMCECDNNGIDTCRCGYTWYTQSPDPTESCDPGVAPDCSTYPLLGLCRFVAAGFGCDPLGTAFTAGVSVTDDADGCSGACRYVDPSDATHTVSGIWGDLNTDTLVCQCPDDLYAQYGPPLYYGTHEFPLVWDPAGTITITGVDDDTKGCPDKYPCPPHDSMPPQTHPYRPPNLVIRWDEFIIDGTNYLEGCVDTCKRFGLPGFIGGALLGPYEFGMYVTEDVPAKIQFRLVTPVDLYIDTANGVSTSGEGDWHTTFNNPIVYTFGGHTITIHGLRTIPCPCTLIA